MNFEIEIVEKGEEIPFGKVIEMDLDDHYMPIDQYFAYRKQVSVFPDVGNVELGILDINATEPCFSKIEKHDSTFECLIPLNGDFIIPLSTTKENPGIKDLIAFRVNKGKILFLEPGCWHGMPCAVLPPIKILVIFKNKTSSDDLIIRYLEEKCRIKFF